MLHVSPSEILTFRKSNDFETVLNILNFSMVPVTYKIQTTSPEKFRVRPRCGLLHPGETVSVNILLKPGEKLNEGIGSDKFLIMAMELPNDANPSAPITAIWKQVHPNTPVKEYRLNCTYESTADAMQYRKETKSDYSVDQSDYIYLNDMNDNVDKLEKQLNFTQILQIVILLLLILLIGCFGFVLKKQLEFDPHSQIAAVLKSEMQQYNCPMKRKI